MDQSKKRLKRISMLAVGVAVLLCTFLLLYAYSPLFGSDEPTAEFPRRMQQADCVKITLYALDGRWIETVKNRFKIQSLAKGVARNLGEAVEYEPEYDVDGGLSLYFDFYRGDELLCTLKVFDMGRQICDERLMVRIGEEEQWHVWTGSKVLEPYRRDLGIKLSGLYWDSKTRLQRANAFWPTPP